MMPQRGAPVTATFLLGGMGMQTKDSTGKQ